MRVYRFVRALVAEVSDVLYCRGLPAALRGMICKPAFIARLVYPIKLFVIVFYTVLVFDGYAVRGLSCGKSNVLVQLAVDKNSRKVLPFGRGALIGYRNNRADGYGDGARLAVYIQSLAERDYAGVNVYRFDGYGFFRNNKRIAGNVVVVYRIAQEQLVTVLLGSGKLNLIAYAVISDRKIDKLVALSNGCRICCVHQLGLG